MVWVIGRWTYGTEHIAVFSGNRSNQNLWIGNFCSIAHGLKLYLAEHHHLDWTTTYPFGIINTNVFNTFRHHDHQHRLKNDGNIRIGNDVWLCGNVTIMAGVTIGDGAIIANNSHVVKDVPPYAMVGGNPARLIRYRFTPVQITNLLKIKWWYWGDDKINENLPLLCQPDIDQFINKHINEVQGDGEVSEETKLLGVRYMNGTGPVTPNPPPIIQENPPN